MRWRWVLVCAAGCGDNLAPEPVPDATPAVDIHDRYQPLTVGSTWTYLEYPKGGGTPVMSTTTVLDQSIVNGHVAYRVHSGEFGWWGNSPAGQYWSRDVYDGYEGDLYVRYETVFFGNGGFVLMDQTELPFRVRLFEDQTVAGSRDASYVEASHGLDGVTFMRSRLDGWRVVATDEQVTVPAGTFTCLHVVRDTAGKQADYWYTRGVGKVMERGGAHFAQLVSYSIAP